MGNSVFFRESAGYSKLLNNKKCMFNAVKISAQLCFSGQAQVSQKSGMIKNIMSTVNSGHPLFFRESTKLLKNPEW